MKYASADTRSRSTGPTAATPRSATQTPKKPTAFGVSAKDSKSGKLLTLVSCFEWVSKVFLCFWFVDVGRFADFSRDLSTIVYARPGGHADLYLLGQK
jgi:hypothetical protein